MSHMDLDPRVIRRAREIFPPDEHEAVLEALSRYGEQRFEREIPRVQMAILTLSDGDWMKLIHLIGAAKRDYRDVLFWSSQPPPQQN